MGYITIDVGTTNTRIRYIENEKILSTYKSNIGVRDTAIRGTVEYLKEALKDGIKYCLNEVDKNIFDKYEIIASGMITSNLGICEIPHVETPVSFNHLCDGIKEVVFKDIIDKPIYFIPGVKNKINDLSINNFEGIDMMRGEEVETFGALSLYNTKNKKIYISTGSHTKFVIIDELNNIINCSTTLTGELLWAISKETILAQSINSDLITEVDKEFIIKGIECVKNNGFTKTCFLIRLLDTFLENTPNQRANFLTGALLYEDLKSINKYIVNNDYEIIIGGKRVLREVYKLVLEEIGYNNKISLLNDDEVEIISSLGAINIFENCRNKKRSSQK